MSTPHRGSLPEDPAATHDRVLRVFAAALPLPEGERAAFLDVACAGDGPLRTEVESLLEHDLRAAPVLPAGEGEVQQALLGALAHDRSASSEVAADRDSSGCRVGDELGPYRLLQVIGTGGFGTVFAAQQSQPIKRRVALKVLKAGMDTAEVIARFEAERNALGLMDHPNIARVHDAGATPTGRPYFVMEYVEGLDVASFCDQEQLAVPDRLRLFLDICAAVQHAHQKGVIHRDLKPSNILVTLQEGKPVPKVIDFGIAKATGQSLSEQTVFTLQGQLMGTPEYMSPEQAEMSSIGVDSTTDIYALGVVLYELLTGVLPFDPATLRSKGLGEIHRILREEEPKKPSTRVATLGNSIGTIEKQRRTDARRLQSDLSGDLDWIVMRAMEKQRTRRYPSASELAADVRRHLEHEPVLAGPPSTAYRIRKFVRRNRLAVSFATVATVLLIGGIIGTTLGMLDARRERNEANEQTRVALAETARATREETTTERVLDFLTGMFEAQDPRAARGATVTVKEVLDRSASRIERELDEEPLLKARLMQSMGRLYASLGLFDEAEPLDEAALRIRRIALGEDDPATLESLSDLAELYQHLGRLEEAESLFVRILDKRRRLIGEDHLETLTSMENLGALYQQQARYGESEELLVDALERLRSGSASGDPSEPAFMNNLANLYLDQRRFDEAEPLLVQSLERLKAAHGEDDPRTIQVMVNLAELYRLVDRLDEAERLGVRTLERSRVVLGEVHPSTLLTLCNLANTYFKQGRLDEAEPIFLRVLDYLPEEPDEWRSFTLPVLNNLGSVYMQQQRCEEAEQVCRKALAGARGVLEPDHPSNLLLLQNLAEAIMGQDRYAEAEPLFDEAVTRSLEVLPEGHPGRLFSQKNQTELYEEWLLALRKSPGPVQPETLRVMRCLAKTKERSGRLDEAQALYLECLDGRLELLGGTHADTLQSFHDLGALYAEQGSREEAEDMFLECLEGRRAVLEEGHADTLATIDAVARLYAEEGRWAEARSFADELVEQTPEDDGAYANRRQLLDRIQRRGSD